MAESPNTNPFNGYSVSWTQPYLPTSYNPFYTPSPEHVATEEMIRIAAVDNIVQNMLTYPDAERILKTVMKQGDSDD
jgi:hypothetical protein